MKFVKKLFEGKKYGFYVSLAIMVLSLVTGIVYISCYNGTDEFNTWSFAFLIIGIVLSAGLLAFKKERAAADVLGLCVFLGVLFYIYAIYYYVSVVMVGIDLDHFSNEFIVTTTFFVITLVLALVNMFLPQAKAKEITEEAK